MNSGNESVLDKLVEIRWMWNICVVGSFTFDWQNITVMIMEIVPHNIDRCSLYIFTVKIN